MSVLKVDVIYLREGIKIWFSCSNSVLVLVVFRTKTRWTGLESLEIYFSRFEFLKIYVLSIIRLHNSHCHFHHHHLPLVVPTINMDNMIWVYRSIIPRIT